MPDTVPHLVQYQGSKRLLAPQILPYLPRCRRLFEPFSGMAAISLAAAHSQHAHAFHLNDVNAPLIGLLHAAVVQPEALIAAYSQLWQAQFTFEIPKPATEAQGEAHVAHFNAVRRAFNQGQHHAANMLYLLARCVKGAVRYGLDGNFNQSPDKRRHGTQPTTMAKNIRRIAALLHGKVCFSALDYREVLTMAQPGDVVYMDPPYQGVSWGVKQGEKGHGKCTHNPRYLAGLDRCAFIAALETLNSRGIAYCVSYDGLCGDTTYGTALPAELGCTKILLNAGLSSQATLLGKRQNTYEALYVSRMCRMY
ncbi:MAG: DNA adenine methylase [Desulfovibrionaceae bacterium]